MPDRLPPDVIEHWPEIFKDIEIKVVPLEYVNSVIVYFDDGQSWEIELDDDKFNIEGIDLADVIEEVLESFFEEYDEYITSIDFRLNAQKIVEDIKQRVQHFLKKRK